jgi:hypothetical protein
MEHPQEHPPVGPDGIAQLKEPPAPAKLCPAQEYQRFNAHILYFPDADNLFNGHRLYLMLLVFQLKAQRLHLSIGAANRQDPDGQITGLFHGCAPPSLLERLFYYYTQKCHP